MGGTSDRNVEVTEISGESLERDGWASSMKVAMFYMAIAILNGKLWRWILGSIFDPDLVSIIVVIITVVLLSCAHGWKKTYKAVR